MRDRYPAQLSGGQRQRVGVARALAADPPLMLMDEPFGAIDPINRERLQNEFLRLQAELRKTIVFVTHDIDEAIKMGDRIAVLKRVAVLAQYAPPAELLMSPADEFVEDFVGADRALKRLALMRVREIDLWKAADSSRPASPPRRRAERLESADVDLPLLVDDDGRPLGWLSRTELDGERVPRGSCARVDADRRPRRRPARRARGPAPAPRSMYGAGARRRGPAGGVRSIRSSPSRSCSAAPGRHEVRRLT